jgi:N6-adenosine-specific RNA methylase IME4/DNA modification methylase
VPKPETTIDADAWLAKFGAEVAKAHDAILKLDRRKVAIDIRARTLDRALAKTYARNRPRLWEELDKIGMTEMAWCKKQGRGNSLSWMRRRMQLLPPKAWRRYLYNRREVGDNGAFSLEFAIHLSRIAIPGEEDEGETDARPETRVVYEDGTLDPAMVDLRTADCIPEMTSKLPPLWFHVIITSMAYWPARRINDPDGKPIGFGFEPTWEEWLLNQRDVARGMKRVIRDDGVLWVMCDDAIAMPPMNYALNTYQSSRNAARIATQTGFRTQDSTYLRPEGNWLGLPWRYAFMMQDEDWVVRDVIIADKLAQGRKESSKTRTRHSFEYIFMFTKRARDYHYDQDALRIPLAQDVTAMSLVGDTYKKQGAIRGDHRDFRAISNPMGRVVDSVWRLPPHYTGSHSAAFPEEFARRALVLTCPPRGRVLDPMGGSGTVAVAASKLGLQVTSIDLNPVYTAEARQRVLAAHATSVKPVYAENGTDLRRDLEREIATGPRYRGILADVAWRAWPTRGKPGAADKHYDFMETEDIGGLRVREVAADDATLFLWVPHSMLEEAFWVMRCWGFENARTGMAWDKTDGYGNGFSFRMQHEHLLVGRRPLAPRHFEDHSISSVLHAPRGEHSEKPPEVHDIVERALGGKGPFLELFGRKPVPGWKVLGNQLPPPDELDAAAD